VQISIHGTLVWNMRAPRDVKYNGTVGFFSSRGARFRGGRGRGGGGGARR
jgi:hypothetical protein